MSMYLLRWQWLLLKRRLFSMPAMASLIANIAFQIMILVIAITSNSDFTHSIVMVVSYTSCGMWDPATTITGPTCYF